MQLEKGQLMAVHQQNCHELQVRNFDEESHHGGTAHQSVNCFAAIVRNTN
jgi:hypothetical protein